MFCNVPLYDYMSVYACVYGVQGNVHCLLWSHVFTNKAAKVDAMMVVDQRMW